MADTGAILGGVSLLLALIALFALKITWRLANVVYDMVYNRDEELKQLKEDFQALQGVHKMLGISKDLQSFQLKEELEGTEQELTQLITENDEVGSPGLLEKLKSRVATDGR